MGFEAINRFLEHPAFDRLAALAQGHLDLEDVLDLLTILGTGVNQDSAGQHQPGAADKTETGPEHSASLHGELRIGVNPKGRSWFPGGSAAGGTRLEQSAPSWHGSPPRTEPHPRMMPGKLQEDLPDPSRK